MFVRCGIFKIGNHQSNNRCFLKNVENIFLAALTNVSTYEWTPSTPLAVFDNFSKFSFNFFRFFCLHYIHAFYYFIFTFVDCVHLYDFAINKNACSDLRRC